MKHDITYNVKQYIVYQTVQGRIQDCTLLYVPSSFAIILMGKRELVALLSLSSWCLVIVVWLFLAVPWVCLQFVIVVFPDYTHLLFFIEMGFISITMWGFALLILSHFS